MNRIIAGIAWVSELIERAAGYERINELHHAAVPATRA